MVKTDRMPGESAGSADIKKVIIHAGGAMLQGIRDYDSCLAFQFGEYMELPPVEKRKVHPVGGLCLGGKR